MHKYLVTLEEFNMGRLYHRVRKRIRTKGLERSLQAAIKIIGAHQRVHVCGCDDLHFFNGIKPPFRQLSK